MTTFTAINLIQRPQGGPIGPELFELVQKEMPAVNPGEILVKQNHMSLDPAMFGWMSPDTNSYIPPVELGTVMRSSGVGEVVESNHPDFKVGDRVMFRLELGIRSANDPKRTWVANYSTGI